jgi:hypothetical protein
MIPSADGKTVFDPATDLNWLADADLARSKKLGGQGVTYNIPQINPDGSMTWEAAVNWVYQLNQHHYLGHSDWRLPETSPTDPGATLHNHNHDPNNQEDYGYNYLNSDMGYLYYKDFGANIGQPITSLSTHNTKYFHNFQDFYYWSDWEQRNLPADFYFDNGFLGTDQTQDYEYVIPVYPSFPLEPPPPPNPPAIVPAKVDQYTINTHLVNRNPDGQTNYDGRYHISWLANADLAKTKYFGITVFSDSNKPGAVINPGSGVGINPDGSMNFGTAQKWIAAMNAADYLGHNNWRLPNGANSAQDYGDTTTEMGRLYYTELDAYAGGTVFLSPKNTPNPYADIFQNFQPDFYWTGTSTGTKTNSHQVFSFGSGFRNNHTDPNELYVLPVYPGTVWEVTNDHDAGPGSLRAEVAAAKPGDTIEFASYLDGSTITLRSTIAINKLLYIVGPGANKLTVNSESSIHLFYVEPYARPKASESTSIYGLTLESHAPAFPILDGGPLNLKSDVIKENKASGGGGIPNQPPGGGQPI